MAAATTAGALRSLVDIQRQLNRLPRSHVAAVARHALLKLFGDRREAVSLEELETIADEDALVAL